MIEEDDLLYLTYYKSPYIEIFISSRFINVRLLRFISLNLSKNKKRISATLIYDIYNDTDLYIKLRCFY